MRDTPYPTLGSRPRAGMKGERGLSEDESKDAEEKGYDHRD